MALSEGVGGFVSFKQHGPALGAQWRGVGGRALAYEVARKTLFGWGIGSGQVPCLGFLNILERVGVQSGLIIRQVLLL